MRTIELSDGSHVGAARRLVAETARSIALNATDAERAALVAMELATNVLRHGGGGELLVGLVEDANATGIELIALDRGPGMANVDACLRDGYSTAGSAGSGLGAVMRLSSEADIYARSKAGTAVLARIGPGGGTKRPPASPRIAWGAIQLPKPGEEACGDAWGTAGTADRPVFMVADGLGHGPLAADASLQATRVFHKHADRSPSGVIQAIHAGLNGTRGAAGAVARIDVAERSVTFSGVGNIALCISSNGLVRRGVSHSGILGDVVHKVQDFVYPISDNFTLVMHSDGLGSRWSLDAYPGLAQHDPMLVAAVLYRDFRRGRDDTTVLVVKGRAAA